MEKQLASSLAGLELKPEQKDSESEEEPKFSPDVDGRGPAPGREKHTSGESDSTPGLSIQLVSDLHIEQDRHGRFPEIPVNAPVLALLGDIGNVIKKGYGAFIRSLAEKFETVLVLAGNHEFYHGEYLECKCDIRRLAAGLPNVHFLDCTSLQLGGATILGCTLWSHVPSSATTEVAFGINDYELIKMQGADEEPPRPLTVAETNSLHRRDVVFLEREIGAARARGETVLVLTHHSPLMNGTSAPQYAISGRALNHAFSTDLSHLMGSPVAAWAYGHTHFNPRGLDVDGTRVLANQKGYNSGEDKGVAFDSGLVLHVKGAMETSVERSV